MGWLHSSGHFCYRRRKLIAKSGISVDYEDFSFWNSETDRLETYSAATWAAGIIICGNAICKIRKFLSAWAGCRSSERFCWKKASYCSFCRLKKKSINHRKLLSDFYFYWLTGYWYTHCGGLAGRNVENSMLYLSVKLLLHLLEVDKSEP